MSGLSGSLSLHDQSTLRRFRLRRLWRVNSEAFLIASVQNIKRLLKPRFTTQNDPDPGVSIVMALPKKPLRDPLVCALLISTVGCRSSL